MYRTDKQFMKNPATAGARIYVGALGKTVIANDLEEKFKQHGNIIGLSLNTGFAFIQYEHDHEAQAAIQKENNSMICGKKIIVKQANLGPQRGPPPRLGPSGPQHRQGPPSGPLQDVPSKPNIMPLLSTPLQQPPGSKISPDSKFKPDNDHEFQDDIIEDDRPNIRPPGPPQHNDDRGRKGARRGGVRGRSNERDRLRFEPPPKMEMFRDREPFYGRDNRDFPPPHREPYAAPVIEPPPPVVDKNDCEIIVVAKALTEYAEFIEQKLKNLGLEVDLLFPNEDVPIGKVLANISSRGCLYAILVMPINEEHRSLTLNILHGITQEHRNMPIDDAMILISRNYESYMKGDLAPSEQSGQMKLLDRHPNNMQILLNLLSENRQITSTQYDKLIKYLQERKELQVEYEVAEGIIPGEESDPKQAELQNRIMNILNKSADAPIPASITNPDPAPTTEPTPILKDPTVQKALDSLMLGDMFKNIATSV
nr:nuclear receptor coactivator 5 [Leptinotarsa decemlineata]